MNGKCRESSVSGRIITAVAGVLLSAFMLSPAWAGVIDVNSTIDAPATATAISQGQCLTAAGECTLRAAIQVADAAPGSSTINVPAGTYPLGITGSDETYAPSAGSAGSGLVVVHTPDPSIGDLNITQSMVIIGAGADQTIIGWGVPAADRVFHIEALSSNISVSIRGLTIQDGDVPDPVVLDSTNPLAVVEFVRYGGGIAIGDGAAVAVVNPNAEHGSGGGGGGGSEGHGGGGGEEDTGFTINAVTLSDVHVLNNYSGGDGGGIYDPAAPLSIENSIISGNISGTGNGGGIYGEGALTIRTTTIGAMVTDSNYTGNSAENGGGLFETGFHTSTIEQSAINGNSAISGGGMAGRRLVEDVITNTTIAGNTAEDTGGGITTNGRVTLVNDTVADNTVGSDSEGGGAGLNSFATGGGGQYNFTLVNTILANNTVSTTPATLANCGGTGSSQTFVSDGHNLEDGDTCGFAAAGDLPNTDPLLQPLAMNGGLSETMALPMASPAVDTGDNASCPNNDQRDSLRPADGNMDGTFICDIGAFELFTPYADLHINDMVAPDSVFVGDNFDVVTNIHIDPGATASSTGVQFTTDTLPADLVVNSATVATAAGTVPCTVANSVVTCVPTPSTLAPGATARMTLNVMAANPATRLTVTANVSQASPQDTDLANNTASVSIETVGLSDLSMTVTPPAQTVAVDTDLVLPFTVANAGPHTAGPVQVGIQIPAEFSYKSVDLAGWTCTTPDTTSVLCTTPALNSGASVSGQLTVTGSVVGTAYTTLGVQARQRDTVPANNSATITTAVQQIADLSLSGSFSRKSIDVGTRTTLALTAANAGPSDATNVTVVTQVPQGLTFETATGGTACTGATTVTCTIGSLAVGQSVQIGLTFKAGQKVGSLTVSSNVQGDGVDPDLTNNSIQTKVMVNGTGGGASAPLGLLGLALLLAAAIPLRRMKRARK